MKRFPLAVVALTLAILPVSALSQAQFDAAVRKSTIEATAKAMRERYVYPDAGEAAAADIERRLASGGYDQIAEPWTFAQKLTQDLQAVTKDRHLRINSAVPPPPPVQSAPPPSPPPPEPPAVSEGGIARADKLAGNVGYIEVLGFPSMQTFKPAVDKTMAGLADTSALIIDLRRNNGGAVDSPVYLASWFVDSQTPIKLGEVHTRQAGLPAKFSITDSMSLVTSGKYLGKPVFVLTSVRTFSAAEAATYLLQSRKLARTVGQTTGGGAHPTGGGPLNPQFSISVPFARGESVVTKTDWEGVGIAPDIPAPAPDALKAALVALGQTPASGDIASLSREKIFAPRSVATPGAEATLRRVIETIAAGQPAYDLMTPQRADFVRANLAQQSRDFSAYGPIHSIRFVGPQNGELFEVTHANARVNWTLSLNAEGKVTSLGRAPAN